MILFKMLKKLVMSMMHAASLKKQRDGNEEEML